MQDGFASALRGLRGFRGDAPLEAWVWRIVLNAAFDRSRSRAPRPVAEPDASAEVVEDAPSSDFARWVGELPERQRLAVFLRYRADLDYRSIALVLGVEVGDGLRDFARRTRDAEAPTGGGTAMNDIDALARAEVAALLPIPSSVRPDWDDVVRRARFPHRRLSRAAVLAAVVGAFAVAAAASPLGAAHVRTLDDFSAWIRGEPGQPASPAEQQAFQEANARSWAGFAPAAKLRRLLETEVSGTSFTLFGFRSGDLLCLRLVAAGGTRGTSTHCAPVRSLQTAESPALVVAADEPVGCSRPAHAGGYTADAYTATFGIASDGVRAVVVKADDGTHDALVGGNAFLYLADHPKVGTRVRGVEAVAGNGDRAPLAFQSSPFGMLDLPPPPKGKAQGPTRVERHVSGGSIGWVERQEPRGEPLPPSLRARIEEMSSHMLGGVRPVLERVVQPDPGDVLRMGISRGRAATEVPSTRSATSSSDRA